MSRPQKSSIHPPQRTGPIKVGSPLYQLLEVIAARVASRLKRESLRQR